MPFKQLETPECCIPEIHLQAEQGKTEENGDKSALLWISGDPVNKIGGV